MRIDERHERLEAVVRDSELADLTVGLGNVLHEPVDGVVRIGGLIDVGRIERPDERSVHDVIALRSILAANVLHDADVPARNYDVERVVVTGEIGREVRAVRIGRRGIRVVRCTGQQDGRAMSPARDEDDGVETHAVPHRDHHVTPLVVEGRGGGGEVGRGLVGEGVLGGGAGSHQRRGKQRRQDQGAGEAGHHGM